MAFREACQAHAQKLVGIQGEEFERLGVSAEWDHPYFSMAPSYQATIVRCLAKFVERDLVYKARKSVHWCLSCKTALAEAEIEYEEDHISPSVDVRFPLSSAGVAALAASVPAVAAAATRSAASRRGSSQPSTRQGVEVALPWKLSLAPTVFVANSFGLTDAVSTCGTDFDVDDPRCVRRVSGQTYGLELSLRRAFGERFTGFFSYTLARSTRLTRPLGFRQRGGVSSLGQLGSTLRIAGEFDRTHVMNLAASYLLGAGWRVGARFYFYTGRPYSEEIRGVPIPPYNGYRYPDFHRFDFRVEKRWTFGSTGYVAFVAEWLHATLRKEAFSLECASFGDSPDLTTSLPGSRCKPASLSARSSATCRIRCA